MTQSRDWPYDENYRLKRTLPGEGSSFVFDNVDSFNPDDTYISERKDSKIEIDISIPIDSVAVANFTKNVENSRSVVDSNLNQELSEAVSNTIDNIFNEEILDLSETKHSGELQETLRPFSRAVIKQRVKVENNDQRTLKILSPESCNDQNTKNFVSEEMPCLSDEEHLETVKQRNADKPDKAKSASIKYEQKEQTASGKRRDRKKFGTTSSKLQSGTPQNVTKGSVHSSPRRASVGNYNQRSSRKRVGPVGERTTNSSVDHRESDKNKSEPKQKSSKSPQKRPSVESGAYPNSGRTRYSPGRTRYSPGGPQPNSGRPKPSSERPLPNSGRPQPSPGRTQPNSGRPQPSSGKPLSSSGRQPRSERPQPSLERPQPTSGRPQPSTGRPVKSSPPGPSKASGKLRTPKAKHPSSAVPAIKTTKETRQTGTSGSRQILAGVKQKQQQRGKKSETSLPLRKGELSRKRTPKDKKVEEHEKNSTSQMLRRQSPIGCEMVSPKVKKPNETSSVAERSPGRTLEIISAESKEGKQDDLMVSSSSFSSLGNLYGSSDSGKTSSDSGKASRNRDLMLKLSSSGEESTHVSGVLRNLLKTPFLLQFLLCFCCIIN